MPLISRVRPRIGDVIEIDTPKGLAYAHYTHKHNTPPYYGALLRVLPGLHAERPLRFSSLVALPPAFSTFFPLGPACNRGIVRIVATEELPQHSQAFPTFRNGHIDRQGKHVGPWFLWNGTREWRVAALTPAELAAYPPLQGVNDTALIEMIVSGWRHERSA